MSRHSIFSITGVLARTFEALTKMSGADTKLVFAAMYGVVELLGAARFWAVIKPIVQQKLGMRKVVKKHAGTQTKKT